MDAAGNNEPVTLSFKLTRWQRVLNPIERLLYALGGTMIPGCILWGLIKEAHLSWEMTLPAILGALLLWYKFDAIATLGRDLFSDIYIDSIRIEGDFVYYQIAPSVFTFGLAAIYKRPRKLMMVTKGLCGTYVLRYAQDGSAPVVLPRTCVTDDQLKQLLPGPKGAGR